MDDLISRKQAIDAAQEWFGGLIVGSFNGLKKKLEAVPSAQPEQRWIPCSEGCPKENGYYLTSTINKEVYCDYWSYDHFDRTEAVVAWIKLPEPYAERRTDG